MSDLLRSIRKRLALLYDEDRAEEYSGKIRTLCNSYRNRIPSAGERTRYTEKEVILITYPDQVSDGSEPKFSVLKTFLDRFLKDTVNTVHILPCFPYSSDDGFSVIDYKEIADGLGGWEAFNKLSRDYEIMADCVLNHISAASEWVKEYCAGNPEYAGFFIEEDPERDLSMTTRPRTLPLLHPFETADGTKHLWTTFSADQVDLNYSNPEVLLRMLDVLLFYAANGASLIRMDAIAYLWKEPGTSCIHLPQTHEVVKLFRDVFDFACPHVSIITETNVPHKENISYFGDGTDEAQMVYQFTLPPLTAWTLLKEDASELSKWVETLELPSDQVTFFNFTASHDGVGVRPLEGILPPEETLFLAEKAKEHGGRVSYKTNPDGSETPYELNINYHSFLSLPGEDSQTSADRFMVSQAIMLSMPGVPAPYFHSVTGSVNWTEGVEETGRSRTINREKNEFSVLANEIEQGKRSYIYTRYTQLLKARISEPAFNPYSAWEVIDAGKQVFALKRTSGSSSVLCLFNVTGNTASYKTADSTPFTDIITGQTFSSSEISLEPFGILWLKK